MRRVLNEDVSSIKHKASISDDGQYSSDEEYWNEYKTTLVVPSQATESVASGEVSFNEDATKE